MLQAGWKNQVRLSKNIAVQFIHMSMASLRGKLLKKGDALTLIHSGSRWFKINMRGAQNQNASEFWMWMTTNYHGRLQCCMIWCQTEKTLSLLARSLYFNVIWN